MDNGWLSGAVVAAIVGTSGSVLVAIIGIWAATKFGIGKLKEDLVTTLQQTVQAKNDRIAELERDLATERSARQALETRVRALEAALADLTMRGVRRRRCPPAPSSELQEEPIA